ncbi:MAG TPA: DUF6531 domain-containing protein, partial [Bryobacteraceae bacterium]|nr:DUF6531 domain-containing protein [Bryobacteraceae bacterium]
MRVRNLLAVLVLIAPLDGANINSISFNQVDFYHNGSLRLANSAWGEFIVNFTQDREGTSFLNVVRQNGSGSASSTTWIVRNLPLPSATTTGTTSFTIERDIDLGVSNGTNAVNTSITFMYSVTPQPMSAAPASGTAGTATIGEAVHQSNSGIGGGPNDIPTPPQAQAAPAAGAAQSTSVWHKNMINVPQGTNQCLPGAMTNSLQWLNYENGYNLNQNPTATLSELAGDMATTATNGTYEEPAVSGLLKFISAHKLPLEIHYYGGGAGNTLTLPNSPGAVVIDPVSQIPVERSGDVTWQNLLAEMERDQNVVALLPHHAIVIEGLTDDVDENGEHHRTVNYREDPMQGSGPAGEKLDTLAESKSADWTDPNAGLGTTALLNGESILTFLVESPVQPPPSTAALPATGEFLFAPEVASGACSSFTSTINAVVTIPSFEVVQMANGNVVVSTEGTPNLSATGQFSLATGMYTGSGTLVTGNATFPAQVTLQTIGTVPNGPPDYLGTLVLTNGTGTCTIDFAAGLIGQRLPAAQTSPALVSDPVSALTGEAILEPRADLSLGGPLPLELRRYYGSLLNYNGITGSVGANWMTNFDVRAFVSGANAAVAAFGGNVIRFVNSNSQWSTLSPYPYPYQFQSANGGFQFLDPASNLIYGFGSDGKLTRIADRNQNSLSVVQGTNGATIVVDGLGRVLTLSYNSNGQLIKAQDQSGRSVSYAYSGASLQSFTDANGKTTTYSTTTSGHLSSALSGVTLPAGNVESTWNYDSFGRVTSQLDGDGNAANLAYG